MADPQTLIIAQPRKPHTHTMIFLHGRGDTAPKFHQSLSYSPTSAGLTLTETFPSIRWIYPRARISQRASFTPDWVSQWFDIWNVSDFSEREELQAEELRDSVSRIREIIEHEVAALDGRSERVVLMGISQGAATAVHTLLHLRQQKVPRLGAFIGFSCRMPFPGRPLRETREILQMDTVEATAESSVDVKIGDGGADSDTVLRDTPILLEHCADDPLVLVENGRTLRETLRGFGAEVTWKEYPDGGHWFHSPTGMDDAVEFLERVLGVRRAVVTSEAMDVDVA